MILGLTGGIGSGKSTVSKILKGYGLKIYDADIIAKEIRESKEVTDEIIKVFGEECTDKNILKKRVFEDRSLLLELNKIIHPRVIEYYRKIKNIEKDIIIFDVPLLFESGIDKLCDKILLIDIDEKIQIERVKKRDGLEKEFIRKIIDNQSSNIEKRKKSDYIIENNGTIEELKEKIINLLEILRAQ